MLAWANENCTKFLHNGCGYSSHSLQAVWKQKKNKANIVLFLDKYQHHWSYNSNVD